MLSNPSSPLSQTLDLTLDEARQIVAQFQPPLSLLAWSQKYRFINGRPFSLDLYPCLRNVYRDEHPFIALMKPNQAGGSEWLINTSLHALDVGAAYFQVDKESLNVGYVFPTWDSLKDFSKDRIRSVAGETRYLADLLAPIRSGPLLRKADLGLYFIRKGSWYLRGGHNPDVQLASFPVDLLIIDEYDLLTARAVTLGEKRLRASPLRWKRYISKPTLPNLGIDGLYNESDQQQWQLRCPACGDWQPPNFWANVARIVGDGKTEYYSEWSKRSPEELKRSDYAFVCRRCATPMNRTGPGRWKAQNPGALTRGYAIPGLTAPYVPLLEMVNGSLHEEPDLILEWYRADLGVAKSPEGGQLSWDDLEGCKADYTIPRPRGRRCTMGVDVGVKLHVRIGCYLQGQWSAIWIGEVDEPKELDALIKRYDVRAIVIDGEPETRMARDFCTLWSGRAWMADYNTSPKPQKEVYIWSDPEDSTQAGTVRIARTESMDRVATSHRERRERLPSNANTIPHFYEQMCAPVRVETTRRKTDGTQKTVIVYMESGPDHYFHASVYEKAARERLPPPRTSTSAVTSTSDFA